MPEVTVWPTPKGLPIASTRSPTSRSSESPSTAGAKRLAVEIGPQQGEVAAFVRNHNPGRKLAPVGQHDLDRAGILDDVVVGHDQASRADDHAGAERILRLAAPALAEIEEAAEEGVVEEGVAGRGRALRSALRSEAKTLTTAGRTARAAGAKESCTCSADSGTLRGSCASAGPLASSSARMSSDRLMRATAARAIPRRSGSGPLPSWSTASRRPAGFRRRRPGPSPVPREGRCSPAECPSHGGRAARSFKPRNIRWTASARTWGLRLLTRDVPAW